MGVGLADHEDQKEVDNEDDDEGCVHNKKGCLLGSLKLSVRSVLFISQPLPMRNQPC